MMNRNLGIAVTLGLLACAAVVVVLHTESVDVSEEHLLESEWIEATNVGKGGANVVDAIVDLKAYALVAKEMLDNMDGFGGKLQSGAMQFIGEFGKKSKREIITEFAETIGELVAKHPVHPGFTEYMLTSLNDCVLKGDSAVVLDAKSSKYQLNPKAFGLRHRPDYFKKLSVSVSKFQAVKQKLEEGSTGKAIAAFKKSHLGSVYHGMIQKITAKYLAMQQKENAFEEAGGKIAIEASYKTNEGKGLTPQKITMPLPVAGVSGSSAVRASRGFKFPTDKEIHDQAMKAAKAAMKAHAKKFGAMSIDQIMEHVEGILEGTTVRVTTGMRLFADSDQSPKLKIVGSLGTVTGKLKYLPLGGQHTEQHFISKGSLGVISHMVLTGDKKHNNPWMATKVEVQVGHGNPWVEFAPNGKTTFVDGWWLDSKSVKGPYYRLAHNKQWLLLPTTQVMKFVKLYSGKEPSCATIECLRDVTSKKMVEDACNAHKKCQGFTFTPKGKLHEGCLKYRCNTVTQDVDTDTAPVHKSKNVDYYVRQAFSFQIQQPDPCPVKCGFKGAVFKGRRYCAQTVDGKEVAYEKCALWHPALFVPKIPSRKCPATPKCVQYVQVKTTKKCTKKCGTAGITYSGKVTCNYVDGGGLATHKMCKDQVLPRLSKPADPLLQCKTTPDCVKYVTKPAQACSSKCGLAPVTHHGSVKCYTTAGNQDLHSLKACKAQIEPKLTKPATPINKCAATGVCAKWIVEPYAPLTCSKKCGQPAAQSLGAVKCQATKQKYIGCFRDNQGGARDLPVRKGSGRMSQNECKKACANYKYFGRQWTEECWCGNSYPAQGASNQCKCNSSTNLGGNVNCVYGKPIIADSACDKHPRPATPKKSCAATAGCAWYQQGTGAIPCSGNGGNGGVGTCIGKAHGGDAANCKYQKSGCCNQCYWSTLAEAKKNCGMWKECKAFWGKPGKYWARSSSGPKWTNGQWGQYEAYDKVGSGTPEERDAAEAKMAAARKEKAAKAAEAKAEREEKEKKAKHAKEQSVKAAERNDKEKVAKEKAAEQAVKVAEQKQKQAAAHEAAQKKQERDHKQQESAAKAHAAAQEAAGKKHEQAQKEQAQKENTSKANERAAKAPVYGPCTCKVALYSHNHMQGGAISEASATGHAYHWHGTKNWHIHSIMMNQYCDHIVLEDNDHSWSREDKTYHHSVGDLPYDLEADIASIRIVPKGTFCCVRNCPPQCTGQVTIYQHNNFQGWSAKFWKGDYHLGSAQQHGFRNDDATSVRVPDNCKLEAYQHDGFHGWKATVGPGNYNLHDLQRHGFRNDDMTSLKVKNLHRL